MSNNPVRNIVLDIHKNADHSKFTVRVYSIKGNDFYVYAPKIFYNVYKVVYGSKILWPDEYDRYNHLRYAVVNYDYFGDDIFYACKATKPINPDDFSFNCGSRLSENLLEIYEMMKILKERRDSLEVNELRVRV